MSMYIYGFEHLHARPRTPDVSEDALRQLQSIQKDRSIEEIQEIIKRVRPAKWFKGSLYGMNEEDLVHSSYIWDDPAEVDIIENPQVLGYITTLHPHGYYGIFRPTIKDTLDGSPDDLLNAARAFTTFGPYDADDLSRQKPAASQSVHVAITVFYM